MNVSDIMTRHPVTVRPDATLSVVLETMARVGCHHLPVVGSQGHLIGIISDHDCQRALHWVRPHASGSKNHKDDKLAQRLLVQDVMTPAPIVVEPDAPVHEVVRLILNNYIRCLPVMRGETLVGIITTSDLLIAFMNSLKEDVTESKTGHT